MISGERKKFKLVSTRKPMLVDGLSNTVLVEERGALYVCHVSFDPSFVCAVGKAMPRGVSSHDLSFLYVREINGKWAVSAKYVGTWEETNLWLADSRPTWLKELKHIRYIDDNSTSTTEAGNARGHTNLGSTSSTSARSTTAETA